MSNPPKRLLKTEKKKRPWLPPVILGAILVVCGAIVITTSGQRPETEPPVPAETPVPVVTPAPTPEPPPIPTPTPIPAHDFDAPAPETGAVEMDYFADALFIGDSRTEGLQLYSGVKAGGFYCYRGLTVFELQNRKVVDIDGVKYSVVEALGKQQYGKIYVSLGVNELGYFDDKGFEDTYRSFLQQLKALQPDAIIYLETIVPVNPEKCKSHKQPYYVTNKQVDIYNEIIPRLARDEKVVLLDAAAALSSEDGVLAAENTIDGVHFTKAWYRQWLDFLSTHTVNAEEYWAGQPVPAPVEGATVNEA